MPPETETSFLENVVDEQTDIDWKALYQESEERYHVAVRIIGKKTLELELIKEEYGL